MGQEGNAPLAEFFATLAVLNLFFWILKMERSPVDDVFYSQKKCRSPGSAVCPPWDSTLATGLYNLDF